MCKFRRRSTKRQSSSHIQTKLIYQAGFSLIELLVVIFIIAMSITHTFLDSIPGIYLGAPDEAMALSILPGHKMLLKGEGHNALKLTVIGSFFSLVLCLLLSPFLIKIVTFAYPIVKNYIGQILIVVITYI